MGAHLFSDIQKRALTLLGKVQGYGKVVVNIILCLDVQGAADYVKVLHLVFFERKSRK